MKKEQRDSNRDGEVNRDLEEEIKSWRIEQQNADCGLRRKETLGATRLCKLQS